MALMIWNKLLEIIEYNHGRGKSFHSNIDYNHGGGKIILEITE